MSQPVVFTLITLIILIAGVTQTMTGFGFGLVAIPLLTQLVEPRLALPMVMLTSYLLNLHILRQHAASVQVRRIWLLSAASMIGSPIGVWILANADVDIMRIYLGIMTCLAALVSFLGIRYVIKREFLLSAPIGFLGGVLSGSTSMGGPLVVTFFTNQGMPQRTFRANIAAYFWAVQTMGLALMTFSGILTFRVFASSIALVPVLVVGSVLGATLARRIHDESARLFSLGVVLVAGVISVLNGIGFL